MCTSCKRVFRQLFAGLRLTCAIATAGHHDPHPPERMPFAETVRVIPAVQLGTSTGILITPAPASAATGVVPPRIDST
jgi:hypothetical protein